MAKDNELHDDIRKIGDLLYVARQQGCAEIDVVMPVRSTTIRDATVTVKAKWREPHAEVS